jgi:hypothetical protein
MGEVSLKAGLLLPAKVADQHGAARGLASESGSISIKVGRTRIRVEGKADVNALAVVLERLLGFAKRLCVGNAIISIPPQNFNQMTSTTTEHNTCHERDPVPASSAPFRSGRGANRSDPPLSRSGWSVDALCVPLVACGHLSMLLEGIEWRRPVRTVAPQLAI